MAKQIGSETVPEESSFSDLGLLIPSTIIMVIIMVMHPIGFITTIALAAILFGSFFSIGIPIFLLKAIGLYTLVTAINPCLLGVTTLLLGILLLVLLFYLFF